MTTAREQLARLLGARAEREGMTRFPGGVAIFRRSEPTERAPVHYDPAVVIVAQGRKEGFLGDQTYRYDPERFLILGVPLPLESRVVEATPQAPLLSLKVPVVPEVVRDLILSLGDAAPPPGPAGALHTGPSDAALFSSALRLVEALEDPLDREVLAPLCVREILYRVLRSERGHLLRDLVARGSHFRRIARVLDRLHQRYDEPHDVASMARVARLGTSTFHQAFKETTTLTPLQYLKQIRLHRARALLISEGLTVSEVSYRVGYSSPSQFSREFKRLFGRPPAAEAERLRGSGEAVV